MIHNSLNCCCIHSGHPGNRCDNITICRGNIDFNLIFEQMISLIRGNLCQLIAVCFCPIYKQFPAVCIWYKFSGLLLIDCLSDNVIHTILCC